MPEGRDDAPDRRPQRASGPVWLATGLVVAAVGIYLANRNPDMDAAPAAAAPKAAESPAMMNNTTRFTLACTATASDSRIFISPYSRTFVPAGAYRCRPPIPGDRILLQPGGSLDFEIGDGGRIAIRRPSAYSS